LKPEALTVTMRHHQGQTRSLTAKHTCLTQIQDSLTVNELPSIAIIGPGKVGTSIGVLAAGAAYPVVAVGGRRREATIAAARRIGTNVHAYDIATAAKSAKLVFLCLPDDAIEKVSNELAQQGAFSRGTIVAHCSGALSSDVLVAARDRCQCSVASMHPLQTFPTVDAALKTMRGAYCFCEGDENAIPTIEQIAAKIGLIPIRIATSAKILYHAAAVTACNYLVALMDGALTLMEQAGIDRDTSWAALTPLVTTTLNNITEMGTVRSLTGPIARGDARIVNRHLRELEMTQGSLPSIYRVLGLYSIEIAEKKNAITATKATQLRDMLVGNDKP